MKQIGHKILLVNFIKDRCKQQIELLNYNKHKGCKEKIYKINKKRHCNTRVAGNERLDMLIYENKIL